MRRKRLALAMSFAAMTSVALVACNLILGNEEPVRVYDEASTADATDAPSTVDAPVDSGTETSLVDAMPDVSTDCSSYPNVDFCDDFEKNGIGAWNPVGTPSTVPGHLSSVAVGASVTGAGSSFIELANTNASGDGGSNPKVHFAFWLRVDSQSDDYACVLRWRPADNAWNATTPHLRVQLPPDKIEVQEFYGSDAGEFRNLLTRGRPDAGTWFRVEVEVDYAATTTLTLTVDGSSASVALQKAFPQPLPLVNAIQAGVVFTGKLSTQTWKVAIDDIVVNIP